jgi:hypothetical protein
MLRLTLAPLPSLVHTLVTAFATSRCILGMVDIFTNTEYGTPKFG